MQTFTYSQAKNPLEIRVFSKHPLLISFGPFAEIALSTKNWNTRAFSIVANIRYFLGKNVEPAVSSIPK